MVDLVIDLSALAELERIESGLDATLERVVDRVTEVGFQAKLAEIAKTDAREIPTRGQVRDAAKQIKAGKKVRVKGGKKNIGQTDSSRSEGDNKPAWKRSGDWANGQSIQTTGKFERSIVTTGNAENYEERLGELPDGALDINRTNRAAPNARNTTALQAEAVAEQELRNAFDL